MATMKLTRSIYSASPYKISATTATEHHPAATSHVTLNWPLIYYLAHLEGPYTAIQPAIIVAETRNNAAKIKFSKFCKLLPQSTLPPRIYDAPFAKGSPFKDINEVRKKMYLVSGLLSVIGHA